MTITPLYAGLLGLWFLALTVRVILKRAKIDLGDGGDRDMLRRIRGHGNFAEFVPLILLMMAMLEIGNFRGWWLHVIGIALLVGRLLHGISLSFTGHWVPGRMGGMILTIGALIATSVLCVMQGLRGYGL